MPSDMPLFSETASRRLVDRLDGGQPTEGVGCNIGPAKIDAVSDEAGVDTGVRRAGRDARRGDHRLLERTTDVLRGGCVEHDGAPTDALERSLANDQRSRPGRRLPVDPADVVAALVLAQRVELATGLAP